MSKKINQQKQSEMVEQVKNTVNLRQYAVASGLAPLPGYDDRFVCPWRSGADSNGFRIFSDGWYDHVTEEHGDCIDFVRKQRNCDFPTALAHLGEYSGIVVSSDNPQKDNSQKEDNNNQSRITAEYDYRDEAGELIFQVVRMEPGRGGHAKGFMQRRPDGRGNWINNLKGIKNKPLYRLPEWIEKKDETIYLVEGEKDVDNLFALGVLATCNSGGAGKWLNAYTKQLSGRKIVIIPDNDAPGMRHLEKVAGMLLEQAREVKILKLPNLPEKGDFTDYLEQMREQAIPDDIIKLELERLAKNASLITEAMLTEFQEERQRQKDEKEKSSEDKSEKSPRRERAIIKDIADSFLAGNSKDGMIAYRHFRGMWYLYRENAYLQIMHEDLRSKVMTHLRRRYPREAISSVRNNVIANLESDEVAALASFRPYPCWLPGCESAAGWLAMENCVINVEDAAGALTGKPIEAKDFIRQHTPKLFSTFKVDYEYNPEAECPRFNQFIKEVQPSIEGQEILQMLAGLSLISDTRYEVVFFLFGPAGTGKTTFIEILRALVGSKNVCYLPLCKFNEKHSMHLLAENLLNIVGDMATNDGNVKLSQVEGLLKDVASGSSISVEHKHKDPINAPAIARCIFAANSLPPFADRTDGIWDRLRIIPFNQRFRHTEKHNPYLKDEIIANELPGIFNWALAGLAKLRSLKNFPKHPEGAKIANEHRFACDHEKEFLHDCYEKCDGMFLTKSELYKDYRNFCENNGYWSKNAANFAQDVKRVFPFVKERRMRMDKGHCRIWMNIIKSQI